MDVIGAGFGRTGTMSLKVALEELGCSPCYHMIEVFEKPRHIELWQAAGDGKSIDWEELYGTYRAAVDWPTAAFYRELMREYPEARVILTVRDPERWYESVRNTIYPSSTSGASESDPPELQAHRRMARTIIWQGTFGGAFEDRQHALSVFERHIAEVKEYVPAGRLLVFDVTQGWDPLCRFLEVDVPEGRPFPRLNDAASFQHRLQAGLRPSASDGR